MHRLCIMQADESCQRSYLPYGKRIHARKDLPYRSVSWNSTCGDCGSANKAEYLTILEFTHFCEFFSFNYVEENRKEKTLIQKITVAVAFELETGNTKNPDIKVNMDTIE